MIYKKIFSGALGLLLILVFFADANARDKVILGRFLERIEVDVGFGAGQSFGGQVKLDSRVITPPCLIVCTREDQNSSSLDVNNALTLGGKLGVIFNGWWGLEFQYFQRELEVGRQSFQNTGSEATVLTPTVPFNGQAEIASKTLSTFAILLMFHTPPERALFGVVRPYIGVGLSKPLGKLGVMTTYDTAGNQVGRSLGNIKIKGEESGFLLLAGINWKVTDQIKIFGEYKYHQFDADLAGFNTPLAGFYVDTEFNFRENIIMFGLTYRFSFGKKTTDRKEKSQSPEPFSRPSLPPSGELSP